MVTAGRTSVRLHNPIMDDNIVESDEYFIVTINPSSLPSGVFVGDPGQTMVTIVDEDSKLTIIFM